MDFTCDSPQGSAHSDKGKRGLTNGFELLAQAVDKQLVIFGRPEWIAHALIWINPTRLPLSG
jgi:hypothetical protein